jgi:SAM-dependent methyltransferase
MPLTSIQTSTTPAQKLILKSEREVAYESPDHLHPWGTKQDNSINRRFNAKLYKLFPQGTSLRILDLGCSGGGFVKNCLDDGCLAVGLEGSDFSKRWRRAEWRTIPEYLFTCDVTGDFELLIETNGKTQPLQFDIVTCWEMMEHIAERDLPRLAENVTKHLAPDGLWIMSVSSRADVINGVNLHQTVQPKSWWITKFAELGLVHREEYVRYFNTQFVRGPKYFADGSFHLVLSRSNSNLPPIPNQGLLRWIYDRWLGSIPQRFIAGGF